MEYEYLLREVFECGRWGDPFGLANADVYRHGIGSDDKHRLVYGISAALKKIRHQNDPDNLELSHEFDEMDDKLWEDQSDENIDRTIIKARNLLKQVRG